MITWIFAAVKTSNSCCFNPVLPSMSRSPTCSIALRFLCMNFSPLPPICVTHASHVYITKLHIQFLEGVLTKFQFLYWFFLFVCSDGKQNIHK
jgi:hypothetical protein